MDETVAESAPKTAIMNWLVNNPRLTDAFMELSKTMDSEGMAKIIVRVSESCSEYDFWAASKAVSSFSATNLASILREADARNTRTLGRRERS